MILIILQSLPLREKHYMAIETSSEEPGYDELSKIPDFQSFTKCNLDPTLFTIKYGEDILLVQIPDADSSQKHYVGISIPGDTFSQLDVKEARLYFNVISRG
ncbi:hypothetical protein Tco_1362961 [Tanacetum coccineum]